MNRISIALSAACLAGLASCAPTVRLSTPDPVKIDVNIRTDVYTHDNKDKKEAAGPAEK